MSVSKWRYTEECNGRPCPGDCDHCSFEPADLISRADAIEAVMKHKMPFTIQQEVAREIDALPSADAVQGEWIVREYCTNELDYRRWIEIECPFCGERPTYENLDNMNFCPNCGAKMKGGDDE